VTPDRSPRRTHRRSGGPPTPEDLEGYLTGVRIRLTERRAAGDVDASLDRELARAEAALQSGALDVADQLLRALDERLDALTPEVEMLDRPRGLVGFTTVGDPGIPMGAEEDPIANRLILVGRLATLRASQGREVGLALRLLAEARQAHTAGDRPAARRAVDRAHALLEIDEAESGSQRTR
jgi:hypothetical protein